MIKWKDDEEHVYNATDEHNTGYPICTQYRGTVYTVPRNSLYLYIYLYIWCLFIIIALLFKLKKINTFN